MFIDDVTIKVFAGSGGKGAVAFYSIKGSKGPTGGNGGCGGNVYFEGTADLGALRQFRFKKEARAQDGEDGKPKLLDGAGGKDCVLIVPVGTVVRNLTTGADREILNIGERIQFAKGGRGGKGNFLFRSSKNTTPMQFDYGIPGENYTLRLELKFIADVGFIGLPNVGKSSLLNGLTNAKSKVANYSFTTLEPNLGVYYDLILADIPGLIEGASSGKGLGIKFLRHIERTTVLFHFISADSKDPVQDYETVRKELENYNKKLLDKPEYIFLSKSDLISDEEIKKISKKLKKINLSVVAITMLDEDSLRPVKEILNKIIEQKAGRG
ncbi:MAG: GTPase ObgE [bacterium]